MARVTVNARSTGDNILPPDAATAVGAGDAAAGATIDAVFIGFCELSPHRESK